MKQRDIFINCPFTPDFQNHFRAIIFVTIRSGFNPRCALETDNGAQSRFDKISEIVRQSELGIHDISKTELDRKSKLPRFNMPLELGLFLGARKFGDKKQRSKRCIIFDREKYRYQAFISDIAGQDIHSHDGNVRKLISELSSWLRREFKTENVPGGAKIAREYEQFCKAIPAVCKTKRLAVRELTYFDYLNLALEWIRSNLVNRP
jgi:hypothetical protein